MVKVNRDFRASVPVHEAREKFRPSNADQADAFISGWCGRCGRYWQCDIAPRAMLHGIDDFDYPTAWIYVENSEPCCTSFTDNVPEPVDVFTKDMFCEEDL